MKKEKSIYNQHYEEKQNYKYQPTHMKIFNVYVYAYLSAYHQVKVCSKKKKKGKNGSLGKFQCFKESAFF